MQQQAIISHLELLSPIPTQLEKGAVFFRAGEVPDTILLLQNGSLSHEIPTHSTTQEALVRLTDRKVWGIKEVMLEEPYLWSARAESPVMVHVIPKLAFLNLVKEKPQMRFQLLQWMTEELSRVHPVLD